MAIIIHPKSIYEKENDKVIDNLINKVNYSESHISEELNYNTLLSTIKFNLINDLSWETNSNNYDGRQIDVGNATNEKVVTYLKTYYITKQITINKYSNCGLYDILKVNYGLDGTGEDALPYIRYTVSYNKKNVTNNYLPLTEQVFNLPDNIDDFYFEYDNGNVENGDISNSYVYKSNYESFGTITRTITATTDDNTRTAIISFNSDTDTYTVTLNLRVGRKCCGIVGYVDASITSDNQIYTDQNLTEAFCEEPLSVSVSFYGDLKKYVNEEKDGSVGIGNQDKPFTLQTNELLQDTNIAYSYNPLITDANPIATALGNKILSEYANGKEIANILCSIGEYYNTDGTLAVSTKSRIGGKLKLIFDIDDIVIPYILSPSGETPMSKYKNGQPKQFRITATEIIFDGAIWQRLTLQEILPN